MSKWTPGPWVIAGKGTIRNKNTKGRLDGWICSVNWYNRDANARLIAAAPEVAEALEALVDAADGHCDAQLALDKARALLARINGEAP